MTSSIRISSPESPISVDVDSATGLPIGLRFGDLERTISVTLSGDFEGVEDRGWTGGLRYENVEHVAGLALTTTVPSRSHKGTCDEYSFGARLGDMDVQLRYRLFPTSPYLEVVAELSAQDELIVRNVTASILIEGDPNSQTLFTPGNAIRRGLRVAELGSEAFGISPLGGLRGSSGLISVSEGAAVLTVWPNQISEISEVVAHAADRGLTLEIETGFAAELRPGSSAEVMLVTLDLQEGSTDDITRQWPDWASRYGLTSPPVKPRWVPSSTIYEVQIGTSYFWGGNSYSRYAEIADLTADLDRVQELGFSVIQLMPRQPYPSYNVHDYADVSTSYGDEQELRQLVSTAHERGMRVILDVLLHGVLDNESMDMAIDGIMGGPLRDRLQEETGDSFGTDLSDSTNYYIAWSRHILDFAEAWKGGSPQRSALQDEHPEWFYRNSAGDVTGVYTKAFDARHPGWQAYFRQAMLRLVEELDVDGFRFDAPTYNYFANWADWARARASSSPLGCVPLFVDLRRDIKSLKPEALMYTEPSGHLLRRSMDLNYNYDEQWLVTALANPTDARSRGVRSAREFMQWIEDRDAFLPVGGQTAHHIDSHDTFWWPQWGKKWRREQFGIETVQALAVAFMALDGPFMMFTGGEEGIESELRLVNGIRRAKPGLWASAAGFDTAADPTGHLFIAVRRRETAELAVVVNLTGGVGVEVPEAYSSHAWTESTSVRLADGQLAPHGYLVLERTLAPM